MDIKVKGSKSTVTVSWDKENEEGGVKDAEKGTYNGGHMIVGGKDVCKSQNKMHDRPHGQ